MNNVLQCHRFMNELEIQKKKYGHGCSLMWFSQAPRVARAASPAERGAEGTAAAQQQAAAAERADLSTL